MGEYVGVNKDEKYYFHGEADIIRFQYVMFPKMLITGDVFNNLSYGARLLYAALLDRHSLSIQNGWFDENNRAYLIYTVKECAKMLNCSESTVKRFFAELVSIPDSPSGIGLIDKVKRLNQPSRIYVLNFEVVYKELLTEKSQITQNSEEISQSPHNSDNENLSESDKKTAESLDFIGEVKYDPTDGSNMTPRRGQIWSHGEVKYDPTERSNMTPLNKTNNNNTNFSNTNFNHSFLSGTSTDETMNEGNELIDLSDINNKLMWISNTFKADNATISDSGLSTFEFFKQDSSAPVRQRADKRRALQLEIEEELDRMTYHLFNHNRAKYHWSQSQAIKRAAEELKTKIRYVVLPDMYNFDSYDFTLVDSLIGYMADIIGLNRSLTMSGTTYDAEYMGETFYNLTHEEFAFVVNVIKNNAVSPKNKEKYFVQCLLNAKKDMDSSYYATNPPFEFNVS